MKIKKIKLLKALALTSTLGIVSIVPIIISSCSVADNNTNDNSNNNNNNNGNNSNNENNSGQGNGDSNSNNQGESNPNENNGNGNQGDQQTETITPKIKSTVTLGGALSNIYDTANTSNTNNLIADEIKKNLSEVFDNGEALKDISSLDISVNHKFPDSTWTGLPFNHSSDGSSVFWGNDQADQTSILIEPENKLLYPSKTQPLTISSLSDLKTQLNDSKLKEILKDTETKPEANTTYSVDNALGFTNKALGSDNKDLLHVNVVGTTKVEGSEDTTTNYDLQIPVSDLNLKLTDLEVTVKGDNVTTSTLRTTLTYNIGINDSTNQDNEGAKPQATESDAGKLDTILVKFGYANEGTQGQEATLNNENLIEGLGIYNVTFSKDSNSKIEPKTNSGNEENEKTYTITLSAKPNDGYVWEDGTSTAKNISFDVILDITAAAQP
ncbi:P35 lipoprotein homolog [Malacoplasma penetrans HF-2]|uniref:P35 lipoprotein homolog n=1 Tax=Malacoplasma penetrans (strain HF-2) TaxID=272633 RepID=Q8EV87_MALP2|nr:P35 family lipoprotein [Malacoplasma penetrans]BAC44471.1 P35 lipoprotein homolog [Malacoplasma penetrans HF-2]